MSKFARKAPPAGYEYLEPTMNALESELRDRVAASMEGMKKNESGQPVHQINWQRSRYVYDMYYTFEMIDKKVYDYCVDNKLVDGNLIAKWKKAGYERLCSTYVINPRNYRFGTVSMCRVPEDGRSDGVFEEDPITGCRGCASTNNTRNIFGNKYGQYLAVVQLTREEKDAEAQTEGEERAEPAYYESTWADEEEEKRLDLSDVIGSKGKPVMVDDAVDGDNDQREKGDEQAYKRQKTEEE